MLTEDQKRQQAGEAGPGAGAGAGGDTPIPSAPPLYPALEISAAPNASVSFSFTMTFPDATKLTTTAYPPLPPLESTPAPIRTAYPVAPPPTAPSAGLHPSLPIPAPSGGAGAGSVGYAHRSTTTSMPLDTFAPAESEPVKLLIQKFSEFARQTDNLTEQSPENIHLTSFCKSFATFTNSTRNAAAYETVVDYFAAQTNDEGQFTGLTLARTSQKLGTQTSCLPLLAWIANWGALRGAELNRTEPKPRDSTSQILATQFGKVARAVFTVGIGIMVDALIDDKLTDALNDSMKILTRYFVSALAEAIKRHDFLTAYNICRELQLTTNQDGWGAHQVQAVQVPGYIRSYAEAAMHDYRDQTQATLLMILAQHAQPNTTTKLFYVKSVSAWVLKVMLKPGLINLQHLRNGGLDAVSPPRNIHHTSHTDTPFYFPVNAITPKTLDNTPISALLARPLISGEETVAGQPLPFAGPIDDFCLLWSDMMRVTIDPHRMRLNGQSLLATVVQTAITEEQSGLARCTEYDESIQASQAQLTVLGGLSGTAEATFDAEQLNTVSHQLRLEIVRSETTTLLAQARRVLLEEGVKLCQLKGTSTLFKDALEKTILTLNTKYQEYLKLSQTLSTTEPLTPEQHELQEGYARACKQLLAAENAITECINHMFPASSKPSDRGFSRSSPQDDSLRTPDHDPERYKTEVLDALRIIRSTTYQHDPLAEKTIDLWSEAEDAIINQTRSARTILSSDPAKTIWEGARHTPNISRAEIAGAKALSDLSEEYDHARMLMRLKAATQGMKNQGNVQFRELASIRDAIANQAGDTDFAMRLIQYRIGQFDGDVQIAYTTYSFSFQTPEKHTTYAKYRHWMVQKNQLLARMALARNARKRMFRTLVAEENRLTIGRSDRPVHCLFEPNLTKGGPSPLQRLLAAGWHDWLDEVLLNEQTGTLTREHLRTTPTKTEQRFFRSHDDPNPGVSTALPRTTPDPLVMLVGALQSLELPSDGFGHARMRVAKTKTRMKALIKFFTQYVSPDSPYKAPDGSIKSVLHLLFEYSFTQESERQEYVRDLLNHLLASYYAIDLPSQDLTNRFQRQAELIAALKNLPADARRAIGGMPLNRHPKTYSALHVAIKKGQVNEAALILAQPHLNLSPAGGDQPTGPDGFGPLFSLAAGRQEDTSSPLRLETYLYTSPSEESHAQKLVEQLLARGADPMEKISDGSCKDQTPIYAAALTGEHAIFLALLDQAILNTDEANNPTEAKRLLAEYLTQAPTDGPLSMSPLGAAITWQRQHPESPDALTVQRILDALIQLCLPKDAQNIYDQMVTASHDENWTEYDRLDREIADEKWRVSNHFLEFPHREVGVGFLTLLNPKLFNESMVCTSDFPETLAASVQTTHVPTLNALANFTQVWASRGRCSPALKKADAAAASYNSMTQFQLATINCVVQARDRGEHSREYQHALKILDHTLTMVYGASRHGREPQYNSILRDTVCHPILLKQIAQSHSRAEPTFDDALELVGKLPLRMVEPVCRHIAGLEKTFWKQTDQPNTVYDSSPAVYGYTPLALMILARREDLVEVTLPISHSLSYASRRLATIRLNQERDQAELRRQEKEREAHKKSIGRVKAKFFGVKHPANTTMPPTNHADENLLKMADHTGHKGYLALCLYGKYDWREDPSGPNTSRVVTICDDLGEQQKQETMAILLYQRQAVLAQTGKPYSDNPYGRSRSHINPADWAKWPIWFKDGDQSKLKPLAFAALILKHEPLFKTLKAYTPDIDDTWELRLLVQDAEFGQLQTMMEQSNTNVNVLKVSEANPDFGTPPYRPPLLVIAAEQYDEMTHERLKTLTMLLWGHVDPDTTSGRKYTQCRLAGLHFTLPKDDGQPMNAIHMAVSKGNFAFVAEAATLLLNADKMSQTRQRELVKIHPSASSETIQAAYKPFQTQAKLAPTVLTHTFKAQANISVCIGPDSSMIPMNPITAYALKVASFNGPARLYAAQHTMRKDRYIDETYPQEEVVNHGESGAGAGAGAGAGQATASRGLRDIRDEDGDSHEKHTRQMRAQQRIETIQKEQKQQAAQRQAFETAIGRLIQAGHITAKQCLALKGLPIIGETNLLHIIAAGGDSGLLNTLLPALTQDRPGLNAALETQINTCGSESICLETSAIMDKDPYASFARQWLTLTNKTTPLHLTLLRETIDPVLVYRFGQLATSKVLASTDHYGLPPVALAVVRDCFGSVKDTEGHHVMCLQKLIPSAKENKKLTAYLTQPLGDKWGGATPLHLAFAAGKPALLTHITSLLTPEQIKGAQSKRTAPTQVSSLPSIGLLTAEKEVKRAEAHFSLAANATPLDCAFKSTTLSQNVIAALLVSSGECSRFMAPTLARALKRRKYNPDYIEKPRLSIATTIVTAVLAGLIFKLNLYTASTAAIFTPLGVAAFAGLSLLMLASSLFQWRLGKHLVKLLPPVAPASHAARNLAGFACTDGGKAAARTVANQPRTSRVCTRGGVYVV